MSESDFTPEQTSKGKTEDEKVQESMERQNKLAELARQSGYDVNKLRETVTDPEDRYVFMNHITGIFPKNEEESYEGWYGRINNLRAQFMNDEERTKEAKFWRDRERRAADYQVAQNRARYTAGSRRR